MLLEFYFPLVAALAGVASSIAGYDRSHPKQSLLAVLGSVLILLAVFFIGFVETIELTVAAWACFAFSTRIFPDDVSKKDARKLKALLVLTYLFLVILVGTMRVLAEGLPDLVSLANKHASGGLLTWLERARVQDLFKYFLGLIGATVGYFLAVSKGNERVLEDLASGNRDEVKERLKAVDLYNFTLAFGGETLQVPLTALLFVFGAIQRRKTKSSPVGDSGEDRLFKNAVDTGTYPLGKEYFVLGHQAIFTPAILWLIGGALIPDTQRAWYLYAFYFAFVAIGLASLCLVYYRDARKRVFFGLSCGLLILVIIQALDVFWNPAIVGLYFMDLEGYGEAWPVIRWLFIGAVYLFPFYGFFVMGRSWKRVWEHT